MKQEQGAMEIGVQANLTVPGWRMALFGTLGGFLISAISHLPTNFAFLDRTYDAEVASMRLQWWVILHWFWVAFGLLTAVYAVLGFKKALEGE